MCCNSIRYPYMCRHHAADKWNVLFINCICIDTVAARFSDMRVWFVSCSRCTYTESKSIAVASDDLIWCRIKPMYHGSKVLCYISIHVLCADSEVYIVSLLLHLLLNRNEPKIRIL